MPAVPVVAVPGVVAPVAVPVAPPVVADPVAGPGFAAATWKPQPGEVTPAGPAERPITGVAGRAPSLSRLPMLESDERDYFVFSMQ